MPPTPSFIPLLSDLEYEFGNVRMDFKGNSVSIDPENAEVIPKSSRSNRKGLVYDYDYPGFDPLTWPYVLGAPESGFGVHAFELEGGGRCMSSTMHTACRTGW